MKKIKSFLIIMIMFGALSSISVYAAGNPYKKTSSFGPNCTWYAWDQAYKKAGVALPGWGNARTWYDSAKKAGFEVSQKPKAKSIVVWEWDKYGHVGYVERVSGDKIYVWDSDKTCIDQNNPEYQECMKNGVSEESDKACYDKYAKIIACEYSVEYWSKPGDLIGYIYLDSAPKTTTTKTTTTSTTTSTTSTSTKALSSNAYLESLTIDMGEIAFDKDTLEYEMEVENNIEKVVLDAKAEDELASIEGIGEHKLSLGKNTINIKVTAEDNSVKTYLINVTRKQKEEIQTTTTTMKKTSNNNKKNKMNTEYFIYVGIFLVLVSGSLIILKLRK